MPSPTRPPLLPLLLQNMLDHVHAFIRLYNSILGDIDLHGPSAIFSLVQTKVVPRQLQQPINAIKTP